MMSPRPRISQSPPPRPSPPALSAAHPSPLAPGASATTSLQTPKRPQIAGTRKIVLLTAPQSLLQSLAKPPLPTRTSTSKTVSKPSLVINTTPITSSGTTINTTPQLPAPAASSPEPMLLAQSAPKTGSFQPQTTPTPAALPT